MTISDESVTSDETNDDTTNSSIDLETVDSRSTLTGDAENDHNSLQDGIDDTVPTDIECHNLDQEEFEVFYQVPVPKNGTPRDLSLTPITIAVVDTIGLVKSRKLLKVLLDPGSSGTMIKRV